MIVIFRKNLRTIILLSSITLITSNKAHPPPRSVNVALETSVLFDPNDLHQNKHFVSNIREFLDKLLMVIDPQKPHKHFRAQNKRRHTKQIREERSDSEDKLENKVGPGSSLKNVFDFVKNVGQTFVNLTGNKIAEAVSNMHVEVLTERSKTKYKGPTAIPEEKKQHNHDQKDFKEKISETVSSWMRRYPEEMRAIMNTTMNSTNQLLKTFARRMNNYYNDDDIKKLKKLLKKFKRYIENNQDTSKIVNELLQNAVFKKYGSLNDSTKFSLLEDLKTFSEFLIANNVFKGLNEHLAVLTRRSMPNQKMETGEIRTLDDITYTNLRRSIDNKLRDVREKNEHNKKKKSDTNEIVAEFLARSAQKP